MCKWLSIVLGIAACAGLLPAQSTQEYTGPHPPKPDLPYLIHADNLVPTEALEAKQENRKGDVIYVIAGANSTARTPLASPAFLVQPEQLQADHIQLYHLQSKGGQRELLFRHRNKVAAQPIRLHITRVSEGLYKIEVDEMLENGEYSLSPSDSNQVFCFQVY